MSDHLLIQFRQLRCVTRNNGTYKGIIHSQIQTAKSSGSCNSEKVNKSIVPSLIITVRNLIVENYVYSVL